MKWNLCLFLLLLLPSIGFAQFGTLSSSVPQPTLVTQPSYPTPGQLVTIEFDDSRSAAAGATLRWSYDGVAIPNADNSRAVQLIAPEVGEFATIKLTLEKNGLRESYQTILKPLYLDIIFEPQTHVPAFYLGRALPTIGSQIRATALLNNGQPLGTNYSYTWRINDSVFGGGALQGQNIITFTMPQGSEAIVSLEITAQNGTTIAKRTLSLPSQAPELYFYELNSLYGLEPRALSKSFNIIANSVMVRAEPYYLDSSTFNQPGILEWRINNQAVTSVESNPYEITLERTGMSGNASLGFHVRSLRQLLQGVEDNLLLNL